MNPPHAYRKGCGCVWCEDAALRSQRSSTRLRPRPSKDSVACCLATMDRYGRMCIGYCGPDCERRPR